MDCAGRPRRRHGRRGGRLPPRVGRGPRLGRPHHRDHRHRRLPAGLVDHDGVPEPRHRPRGRDRGRAGLQAAAARAGRETRVGRCVRGAAAAAGHVHRAAAAAQRGARSVGRVEPVQDLAAGAADRRPLAGRLRGNPLARHRPRRGAHRFHRRPGVVDGGDAVVRETQPR